MFPNASSHSDPQEALALELSRRTFEGLEDYAIFTTDLGGLVNSWNVGAEKIFGYRFAEILHQSADRLWTPEDRSKGLPAKELEMAARDGRAPDDRWHLKKDGSRFFANGTTRALHDASGELIGFAKICRDVTDQWQAEHDLAEARSQILAAEETEKRRLKSIFESSPSFMATLRGPCHVFEQANDRFYQMAGRRELIGRPVREAMPELADQGFIQLLDQVFTTGEPFIGRGMRVLLARETGKEAEECYLDFVYQPVLEPDGSISGVFVNGVDLTQRLRAEWELETITAQRRLAKDTSPLGWWRLDIASNQIHWDDRLKSIFALRKAAISDSDIKKLIHPDDVEIVENAFAAAVHPETAEPFMIEYRIIHPDGSVHWVLTRGEATFKTDETGRHAISIAGNAADITQLKKTQSAIFESELRFRQLADAMPQIVWQASATGVVDYFNQRWTDYTGVPAGEIGDATWAPAIHRHDLGRIQELWNHSVATGTPYEAEYRFRRASDGEYRWHLARALPIKDSEGKIIRWFGTNTDIHENRQLQERNQELLDSERAARAEAEKASRMKDEFLATLSHELRTPLSAILGWSQILRSGKANQAHIELGLETIERNAHAQLKIIEDLLDMSRIISGKVQLKVEHADLATIVLAAVQTMTPAADAKNIQIIPKISSPPHLIGGDPNRLQQIFWNLLSNAVKFTPTGGTIEIFMEKSDSHSEVRVTDNGEGISPEFLPYVFDRFQQEDASITRRHGGLGIGLAIVKQLVELHGGNVHAESTGANQGSTFVVKIPCAPPEIEPASEKIARSPSKLPSSHLSNATTPTTLDGLKILVIDDEPDARALLRQLLENLNATVFAAGSAKEGFEMLRQYRPDLLVSDIGMPGEDGYSLIRKIRALSPADGGTTPAIALTAYARPEDRSRAFAAGFQHHVTKPLNTHELIQTITELIASSRP
jgi:PAS domain S-box-containing protein